MIRDREFLMSFRLLSENSGRAVLFETVQLREIEAHERIHYMEDGEIHMCCVCGHATLDIWPWTDNAELWQRSAMRCL